MSGFNLNISLRSGKKVPRSESVSDLVSEESPLMPIEHSPKTEQAEKLTNPSVSTNETLPTCTESASKTLTKNIKPIISNQSNNQGNDNSNNSNPLITMAFNSSEAIKLIPEFSGNSKLLQRFLQVVDFQYENTTTAEEKAILVRIVKSKLTEKAFDIINTYNQFNDWTTIKTTLKKQFSRARSIQLIHSDMFNLKQNYNESVTAYSHRLETLLEELNVASSSEGNEQSNKVMREYNETIARNSFCNGLWPTLKITVQAAMCNNLHQAIDLAMEVEKTSCTSRNSDAKSRIYCRNCNTSTHLTKDCRRRNFAQFSQNNSSFHNLSKSNQNNTNFRNFVPNPNSQYFRNSPNPINTYQHMRNYSVSNHNSRSHNNSQVNLVNDRQFCKYCKKAGHSIEDCRKRAFNNAKNGKTYDQNSNQGNFQLPGPSGTQRQVKEMNQGA